MNEMSQDEKEHRLRNRPSQHHITPEHIDSVIESVRYIHTEATLTLAIVVLQNGYEVIGQSACADPKNFDAALGQQLALEDAKKKVWPLEAYLLKQRLWERNQSSNVEAFSPVSEVDPKPTL